MSGVTKELDILKQLFENLSDTDKQAFLTSVSQKEQVKKVIEPRKITNSHIANLRTLSKMEKTAVINAIYVAIAKNPLLNKQARFYLVRKKILKFGKNTFIA